VISIQQLICPLAEQLKTAAEEAACSTIDPRFSKNLVDYPRYHGFIAFVFFGKFLKDQIIGMRNQVFQYFIWNVRVKIY
jgi:hypothetical protein